MDKATFALILSAAAIAVSGTIGILGYRLQRRVTAIAEDRRSEEVESQRRANLNAHFDSPVRPCRLVLSASGGSSARDVVVQLEPATIPFPGRADVLPVDRARTSSTRAYCDHTR